MVENQPSVGGDEPDPTSDPAPADPPGKSSYLPWLIGGVALGVAIGLAGAPYVAATREFFRAPGWGWAAVESAAHTVFRMR